MAVSNTPRAKTERLMNLTMCLLSTRRALPKARIRTMVESYAGVASDEAFERMFERDKDELRELGIPLVTEHIGGAFDDEVGYRIDQRDYALPEIDLEPDELAVVGLATRTWEHAALAPSAATAWRKVSSADGTGEATETPFVGIEPSVGGGEPAFAALKDATLGARSVTFDYAKGGAGRPQTRRVDPWSLTAWRGRWYLTGYDHDRGEPRIFRLSRITSAVQATGPLTHPAPDEHDPQAAIEAIAGGERATTSAVLRVRVGAGHSLRRRARSTTTLDDDWDRVELEIPSPVAFAEEVVGYGADVVAEQPPELVDAVVARLRGVLGQGETR
ncbi:WYL domain-containing protein [Marihabitans asiaticum]|uniref:helix-turn-helix transcriptional regulator n=1 Tax=Marihabitans asiaticum TaxID=415218 RepID=UPI0011A41D72|nr:WYL domain-containing protein [Marihabitans asiaticum]